MSQGSVGVPVTPSDVGQKPVDCEIVGGLYRQKVNICGNNSLTGLSEEIWKDAYTGSITQIGIAHAAIHLGLYMGHSGLVTIQAGAYFDHLIKTPANFDPAIHLRIFQISTTSAPVIHRMYEAPTVTVEGSATNKFNFNRNSAAPVMGMWHSPTVDITGITPFNTRMITGTITDGGLGETSGTEWCLKPDTYYLSRITNDSGAAADVNYSVEWYEL